MSDTKSLNSSLPAVIISSKDTPMFIRDLSYLMLKIIIDAWWTSMNVGSKQPFASNDSSNAPSWQFYLPCGIAETGSPGIIYIVCHQVLHDPSAHGNRSMGKLLQAKAHIPTLNILTVS